MLRKLMNPLKGMTFCILAGLTPLSAAADDAKPLPKFEGLLPSEHFFNKEPIPVGHTYGFATNKNLEQLKKLLLKALGDGWKLEIMTPAELKEMNKGSEVQIEGVGQLVHQDFGKYSIGVTLVPMPEDQKEEFKDYTKILSIVTVDIEVAKKLREKDAAQDNTDASEPEPEANKPKSE